MNTKNESIRQSNETFNLFHSIYYTIKDLIEAGEHDIFTINGKNIFYILCFFLIYFT